jgi:hypothetical protein
MPPPSRTPSSTLIPASRCANTYVCPGGGSGYGIQFNIVQMDIDTLIIPPTIQFNSELWGLTVAAAAVRDYKAGITQTSLPLLWWWNNFVMKYLGVAGPTPMTCVQPGQNGFAVGLAQTIVGAFNISPTRICNARLIPTVSANDVDIETVRFTFYITDIRPKSPLPNDYLPSSCIGNWIMSWLSKSTSVTDPSVATTPIPADLPLAFQTDSCPGVTLSGPSGSPSRSRITPTLYFTSEIDVDKDKILFIKNLKDSFRTSFSNNSMLAPIFHITNIEHATNVAGTSVALAGVNSNMYTPPQTLTDYFIMYSYPLAFIGAILFTIVQIIDVNLNTLVANKNISIVINISFIVWSVISLSVFYNIQLSNIPILGSILTVEIPYILPLNTQAVVTQS